ncbi:MAG: hypothetical protein MUC99_05810 [Anaerolineae bacterium]|jgi:hypothetical protein|nr:hypothetical protein [Anaerolineae bacterium]
MALRSVQQAIRRTGWRPERQAVTLGLLGVFLALVMGGLYLSQVATEASRGREMRDLIAQRDELERFNEALRVEIAELQSLGRLQARARELGFVPADQDDQIFVVVEGYSANRTRTVAPLQSTEDDLPQYSESFSGWLQQQLDTLRQQFEAFSGS